MNYNFINTGKANLNEYASRLDKMRNLMERIENNPYGRLLEEGSNKRVQVSKEEFLDLLKKSQEYNSDNGQFASVTYVKSAYDNVRKVRKGWDEEAVGKALSDTQGRSGEEWHKGLTSFQNGEIKKNPITQIIVAQRYTFHWLNEKAYDKKKTAWQNATDDNRLAHGLPMKFKDPTVSHRKFDSQDGMIHIETANTNGMNGNAAFQFNMAGVIPETTAYLVDSDGNKVCELPKNVYKAIKKPHYDGPEKEAIEQLKDQPELLKSYAEAKKKIDSEFQGRPFKSEQILCMAMSIGGTSYYYINPSIIVEVTKGGATVNPEEWKEIAEKLIGETFVPIESEAFAQDNSGVTPMSNESRTRTNKKVNEMKRKQTIRLTESRLRKMIYESVRQTLMEAENDQYYVMLSHESYGCWYIIKGKPTQYELEDMEYDDIEQYGPFRCFEEALQYGDGIEQRYRARQYQGYEYCPRLNRVDAEDMEETEYDASYDDSNQIFGGDPLIPGAFYIETETDYSSGTWGWSVFQAQEGEKASVASEGYVDGPFKTEKEAYEFGMKRWPDNYWDMEHFNPGEQH